MLESSNEVRRAAAFYALARERYAKTKLIRILAGASLDDVNFPASGDDELDAFAKGFVAAFAEHDWELLMSYFSPHYVKEQHDEMLKGHTGQFLSETLGVSQGCDDYRAGDNAMTCLNRTVEPRIIELVAPEGIGPESAGSVIFSVRPKKGAEPVRQDLALERLKAPKRHAFGLFGAYG